MANQTNKKNSTKKTSTSNENKALNELDNETSVKVKPVKKTTTYEVLWFDKQGRAGITADGKLVVYKKLDNVKVGDKIEF